MARHSSSVLSPSCSLLPEELLVLQMHELLTLDSPAWGLEAPSEPSAAAPAGARTEEVELWDKKCMRVTNVPGRDAPPTPFQMQAPWKMLLATSRALHLSVFAALFSSSRPKIQRLLLHHAQNDTTDTANQSRHLLMMFALALG